MATVPGVATNARDTLPMAGPVTHSPQVQLQPLARAAPAQEPSQPSLLLAHPAPRDSRPARHIRP